MIAMQYNFALPADYDMAIIHHRIASKGHLMDGFPGLVFKAYLSAAKAGTLPSRENLYAPFYLWEGSEGMNNFLCGEGFAGVSGAFGWPSVKTWSVWASNLSPDIAAARYATREIVPIAPHASLGALRQQEREAVDAAVKQGHALTTVSGFDPANWSLVRFRLWSEAPAVAEAGVQVYEVGHLSLPDRPMAASQSA